MRSIKAPVSQDFKPPAAIVCVASAGLVLSSCAAVDHGFLGAAGPVADFTRDQFLLVSALVLIVALPVFVVLPIILWRYRFRGSGEYRPEWDFSLFYEVPIWAVPVLVVLALGCNLFQATMKSDPYRPIDGSEAPLEVEVVGLDWKWLFLYPGQQVASVDSLVLPKGRPVHFHLTSGTVLQSFMIPKLGSQIYAMPHMVTELWLEASTTGGFVGLNTQFNGTGFAKQRFDVRVVDTADFNAWVAKAAASPVLDESSFETITKRSVMPEAQLFGGFDSGLFEHFAGWGSGKMDHQMAVSSPDLAKQE